MGDLVSVLYAEQGPMKGHREEPAVVLCRTWRRQEREFRSRQVREAVSGANCRRVGPRPAVSGASGKAACCFRLRC